MRPHHRNGLRKLLDNNINTCTYIDKAEWYNASQYITHSQPLVYSVERRPFVVAGAILCKHPDSLQFGWGAGLDVIQHYSVLPLQWDKAKRHTLNRIHSYNTHVSLILCISHRSGNDWTQTLGSYLGDVRSVQKHVPLDLLLWRWRLEGNIHLVEEPIERYRRMKLTHIKVALAASVVVADNTQVMLDQRIVCVAGKTLYSDNYLDLLSLVDTLLIAANIVSIFHVEELIDIGLLRRHVDNNFLTRRRAASSERYRRTWRGPVDLAATAFTIWEYNCKTFKKNSLFIVFIVFLFIVKGIEIFILFLKIAISFVNTRWRTFPRPSRKGGVKPLQLSVFHT